MELVDYLRVLRRRWALVALAALVCAGAAVGFSLQQDPLYQATARLVVSSAGGADAEQQAAQQQSAVQRATTYAQFASTPPAVAAAVREAGVASGGAEPEVTATAEGGSPFLAIAVTDAQPERAAAVANAYVASLPEVVAELERSSGVQALSVLAPATVPTQPFQPQPMRNGGIGLALGLLLGVGSAFLREALDRTYKDPDQIEEETRLSVLGVVPQELASVALPTLTNPSSNRAEAYRTVRTNVQFAGPPHTLRTILVTSATAGEGKTSVSTNLAIAFAATGQSVVLVDADLRRRSVAKAFELEDEGPGLAGVLAGWADLDSALRAGPTDQLTLLPAGSTPVNPSELLASPTMVELLKDLGDRFEVVLVDSPPVLPVTDPLVLAVEATGVVVVVRLGTTPRERLKRTLGSLQKLDVPVLGIVGNGAVASQDPAYGYGYTYGYEDKRGHGRRRSDSR